MDYDKAVRTVRAAALRALPPRRGRVRRGLTSPVPLLDGDGGTRLLRAARRRADATDAEIKKAFRKLARELHPDVSQEPDAQERFRAVAEAYEVLSKAETRQLYDRYGHAGLRARRLRAEPTSTSRT